MTLQDLFEAALAYPESEREAFLERATADSSLRLQVLALLRVDARLAGTESVAVSGQLAQWAAGATRVSIRAGDMIGPFRVCELIGQGGMGLVFRAEREEPKQQVAIKVVRDGELDALYRERLRSESQALAALDHAYIARLIDLGELPDGTPYVVMEYVDGMPLDQYCRQKQLGVRARVQLALKVCSAVAHAHRHLIVHRDLKPSNILVTGDGLPKLLDFGIAKRLDNTALGKETGTAQRFFSTQYAAPEQVRGGTVSVGADVYALGVILFELLSEQSPFDFAGLSFGQIEQLITHMPAPAPSARAPRREFSRQLRGDLDGIVQLCLRKSPGERYHSVSQLAEDLSAWLQALPVRARGGHRWYRVRKFVARHRVAVSVAMLAVAALATSAVMLWQQNHALRQQRDLSARALGMMQDAFITADPMRTSGADLTARQILESARRKLSPLAEQQPELFATLAKTIVSVDLALGRPEPALSMIIRARQAADDAMITDEGNELALLHARALTSGDQREQAQAVLDKIAAGAHRSPAWQLHQARLWLRTGEYGKAVALLESALQRLLDRGPSDELATYVRHALAEARGVSGDTAGELREIDTALTWQKAELPDDHPQIIVSRMRRLIALYFAQQYERVNSEAEDILAQMREIYGEDSAAIASVYNTQGQALAALKRNASAIECYRKAHEASTNAIGAGALNTLRMHFNLAYTLAADGQSSLATQNYRTLLSLAERREGGGALATTAYYRINAAEHFLSQQDAEEAVAALTGKAWQQGYQASSKELKDKYRALLTQACSQAVHAHCEFANALESP